MGKQVFKGVASSSSPERRRRSDTLKEKRKEAQKGVQHEVEAVDQQESTEMNLEKYTDSKGKLDEGKLESSLNNWAQTENVNWNNADNAFLERAEYIMNEMIQDGEGGEKLQRAWMDIQAVIDGRERAQEQVNTARESAETIAQAQAESPEAAELAKLKAELKDRKDEMNDLAAALGWKKMFNGQYRSLTREVKNLEQTVANKEQQAPQKKQKAA